MQVSTDAIVLKNQKRDEDRILTLLTRESGVVTAYANGAGRLRSKLACSTELLCYSHFILFQNRERTVVDSADSERVFFGIRGDIEKLALASYFAEITAYLAPRGESSGEYLRLLLNTLHYLEDGTRPPALLKPVYELRLLTLSGYMPELVACARCGRYEAGEMWFYSARGDLACKECLAATPQDGGVLPGAGVLAAMRHIVFAPFDKLFGFSLSDEGTRRLEQIAEGYLQYRAERTFPTLEFYRSLHGA